MIVVNDYASFMTYSHIVVNDHENSFMIVMGQNNGIVCDSPRLIVVKIMLLVF